MPKPQADVNVEPDSSPAPGVTADSPAATDVNVSAPSPEDAPTGKTHEDAIPYSRFKEEIEKNRQLKEELESMKAQYIDQPPTQFDWNSLYPDSQPAQPAPQQPQQQQIYTPEQIEEKLREDLMAKPFQTLYPIMMEAAKQVIREESKQESRVRGIPDFKSYESDYYGVPEEVVLQAQSDPKMIRFLLAKHRATVTGKAAPQAPPASNRFIDQPVSTPAPSNGPSRQPSTMEDLAEKYRKEGEARVIEKLRSQQGFAAEGAATIASTPVDEPELDEEGARLMAKLGISGDRTKNVAKRLDNFVKGR